MRINQYRRQQEKCWKYMRLTWEKSCMDLRLLYTALLGDLSDSLSRYRELERASKRAVKLGSGSRAGSGAGPVLVTNGFGCGPGKPKSTDPDPQYWIKSKCLHNADVCTEGGHRNFYGSNHFRIMSFPKFIIYRSGIKAAKLGRTVAINQWFCVYRI